MPGTRAERRDQAVNKQMGRLGFEPRANALKGRCSTTELPTHGQKTGQVYHVENAPFKIMLPVATIVSLALGFPNLCRAQATQDDDVRAQARAEQRRQQRRSTYRSYFSVNAPQLDGFEAAQQITDLRRSGRNKLWIPEGLENQDDWLRWSVNGISPWQRWLGWYRESRPEDSPLSGAQPDLSLENRLTLLRGEKRTSSELHRVRSVIGAGSKGKPSIPGFPKINR